MLTVYNFVCMCVYIVCIYGEIALEELMAKASAIELKIGR